MDLVPLNSTFQEYFDLIYLLSYSNERLEPINYAWFSNNTGSTRYRHLFVFWIMQRLNEPENKEVSIPTAAGSFSKLQQSSLNEPENKEVSVPTAAGAFSKLQQSALIEPENKEVSVSLSSGTCREDCVSLLKAPITGVTGNSGFVGSIACLRDLLTMISSNHPRLLP
jgi:hypothetical protein